MPGHQRAMMSHCLGPTSLWLNSGACCMELELTPGQDSCHWLNKASTRVLCWVALWKISCRKPLRSSTHPEPSTVDLISVHFCSRWASAALLESTGNKSCLIGMVYPIITMELLFPAFHSSIGRPVPTEHHGWGTQRVHRQVGGCFSQIFHRGA